MAGARGCGVRRLYAVEPVARRLPPFLAALAAVVAVLVGLAAGPAAAAPPNPPNDSRFGDQGGLSAIKAPEAWAKGTGSGIKVAVVSTGIAKAHPDLADKTDAGFDFTGGDPATDGGGQGTHLAGIVGAATHNGVGIAAVAPDARLVPYKAYESGGPVDAQQFFEALLKVGKDKPQVALIDVPDSFPGDKRPQLNQFLASLGSSGISVVVGAQADLPDSVLAVTAGPTGAGPRGVAAPGQDVLSTTVTQPVLPTGQPTFGYGEVSGNRQAAAHAAGAAAVLRGLGASSAEAADLLRSTGRPVAGGTIDVAAATAAYKPPTAPPPPPTTTTPTTKPAAKPPATVKPTGVGAIPTGPPAVAGFTGPPLPDDPIEEGEEDAVVPPGADEFDDLEGAGGPISGGSDEDTRPLGELAVGFGLLFGVGSGLSITLRRLADASL